MKKEAGARKEFTYFSRTQKKGQMFLIGAMLFIIIILGMASVDNFVVSNSPNYNFDFIAKNVKSEMVRVVEKDINTGGDNLGDFINLTAAHIIRSYPGADFLFVYGNSTQINFVNYIGGVRNETFNSSVGDSITIKLNGENYFARVYPSNQVYFGIEKIEKNGVFIGFA